MVFGLEAADAALVLAMPIIVPPNASVADATINRADVLVLPLKILLILIVINHFLFWIGPIGLTASCSFTALVGQAAPEFLPPPPLRETTANFYKYFRK